MFIVQIVDDKLIIEQKITNCNNKFHNAHNPKNILEMYK